MKVVRWTVLLVTVLATSLFAYWNGGERTTLDLGVTVVYRVSLVFVVLGAFLLGMISMFIFGLAHDLRLRRTLRERERDQLYARPRFDEYIPPDSA